MVSNYFYILFTGNLPLAVKAAARHSLGQWRWRNMTNGEKADSTGLRLLLQVFRLVLRCWDHVRPKNNLCFLFRNWVSRFSYKDALEFNISRSLPNGIQGTKNPENRLPPPHNFKDLICEGGLK